MHDVKFRRPSTVVNLARSSLAAVLLPFLGVCSGLQPAVAAHVSVYVQPYSIDLSTQGAFAVGEVVPVSVSGLAEGTPAEGLVVALMKGTNVLAAGTNFVASGKTANGSVDCATAELAAVFAGAAPLAERDVSLAVWDSVGGGMVAVGSATARNLHPFSAAVMAGWTNASWLASNEWRLAVEGLSAEIARLQGDGTVAGVRLDALEAATNALDGAVAANAGAIDSLRVATNDLSGLVASNAASIRGIQEVDLPALVQRAEYSASTNTLWERITDNAFGILALRLATNTIWESISSIQTATNHLADGVATNAADIALLRVATNALNYAIVQNGITIGNLQGTASALVAATGDLSRAVASLQNATNRLNSATNALNTRVGANATGISSNAAAIAELRHATNALRLATNALNWRIGSLETNRTSVQEQVARLNMATQWAHWEIELLKYATNALHNRVGATESAIAELPTREWMINWVGGQGFLTNHQSLDAYAQESYVSNLFAGVSNFFASIFTNLGTNTIDFSELFPAIAELQNHASDTNNPHGVTMEQLDDGHAFAAWFADKYNVSLDSTNKTVSFDTPTPPTWDGKPLATTDNLPDGYAVCKGGWWSDDFFAVEAMPGRYGSESSGPPTATTNNSVVVLSYTNTAARGWVLKSRVYRHQDPTNVVTWTTDESAVDVAEEDGAWYVDFTAEFDPVGDEGTWYTLTGRLGSYETEVELCATNVHVNTFRQFFAAASGSLLAGAWECVVGAADGAASNAGSNTWTGALSETNWWSWSDSCWLDADVIGGLPISLRADIGGTATVYRPLTLVTPRHAVAAGHFAPPKGSTNWWLDGDGDPITGVVDSWVDIREDLRLVRLKDTVDRGTALVMPDHWAGFFLGADGVSGVPGVPVVSLECREMARVAFWTPRALTQGDRRQEDYFAIHGNDGAWTDGRFDAPAVPGVGGDSGSPAFLAVKDDENCVRLVLLGCFWHGGDGPLPTAGELNRAIEQTWPYDTNRVVAADFRAWGYTNYLDGDLSPW